MPIRAVPWPVLVPIFALCSTQSWSAQPSPASIDAYKRAVTAIEQREQNPSSGVGQLSCSAVADRVGTVLVQRLPVEDSAGYAIHANDALIHHWSAAMFIPHVRPEDVVAVLQDYDHHAEIYAPDVSSSKLVDKQGSRYRVLHETLSRNLITVGLRIDSVVDWFGDGQHGFSSHSTTIRVSEFEHAGTPRARERSPDQAKGWMWATDSWWHVTPKAEGACVTYEMIALTRDIPWGWGWLLRGIVERFPAKTLTDMLDRTRNAVLSRRNGSITVEASPAVTFSESAQTKAAGPKNEPQ
jgi:hypothetical protein